MREHFYLNSSNLEYIRKLKEDHQSEYVYEYDPISLSKAHQNEWGRIKTDYAYYHILLGHITPEGCPWCGAESTLTKIKMASTFSPAQYCLVCIQCGSRGPILNVFADIENNPIQMENIKSFMNQKYKARRAWDEGLNEPRQSD